MKYIALIRDKKTNETWEFEIVGYIKFTTHTEIILTNQIPVCVPNYLSISIKEMR